MKKTALVLSGGGFKGAFQLGALKYLKENWHRINPEQPVMHFDIIAGVSVGSLNGLFIALNRLEELEQLWHEVANKGVSVIYNSPFIDTQPEQGKQNPKLKIKLNWQVIKNQFPQTTRNLLLRSIFNKQSIFESIKEDLKNFKALADNTPLYARLRQYAKRSDIQNIVYKCGYVSLNDGQYYSNNQNDFASDEDFAKAILASTTMPIVWKPVTRINLHDLLIVEQSVDGGIRNVSPLGDVIKSISKDESEDEYTIIIINCSSGIVEYQNFEQKNIFEIALRSLNEIAITEVFNNDIEEFIDKNYLLEQFKRKLPGEILYDYNYTSRNNGRPLKFFSSVIIQPDPNILGDTLVANDVMIEKRIKHGMEKAEKIISQLGSI